MTGIFIGLIYPLSLIPAKMVALNGDYQKAHIQTIQALLQEGDDYVAGIELIYNQNQPIAGMRHLMGPAVSYLYAPTPKLKAAMLASLDEDPDATITSVIQALQVSHIKFYVNNYRMHALPKKIKDYLDNHYAHWWGSIYLYAPLIAGGKQSITLQFAGDYLIDSTSQQSIEINGQQYLPNSIIHLQDKKLISNAEQEYRLKLVPASRAPFTYPVFQQDNWEKMLF
jgi:hypothetical protein